MPRSHRHHVDLPVTTERAFSLLITPSAIRTWWGASRAIVLAHSGGLWVAAWGADEDRPEYILAYTVEAIEPPRLLRLTHSRYLARTVGPPFDPRLTVEFTIDPLPGGCRLCVANDGFPDAASADEFLAGCERGWRDTFASIRRYVAG